MEYLVYKILEEVEVARVILFYCSLNTLLSLTAAKLIALVIKINSHIHKFMTILY
jgi:hypothetical protein